MVTLLEHAKRIIKKLVDKPPLPAQKVRQLSGFALARMHEQRHTFTYLAQI